MPQRQQFILPARFLARTIRRCYSISAQHQGSFRGKNGGQIIAEKLKSVGVDRVFGVPGTKLLPVLDSVQQAGINFVMARHEQGATFMAEGYASAQKTQGKPGVVLVSSGPGFTNTLTPIYDAFYQNLPLMVFSSQAPTHLQGTGAFQETNAVEIAKHCTKWATEAKSAHSLPRIVEEAFQISTSGRPGPVFIDVPEDILHEEFGQSIDSGIFAPKSLISQGSDPDSSKPSETLISQVADKINNCQRPLLIVGHAPGLNSGPVVDSLRHLVAKIQIPFTSTFLGWGTLNDQDYLALQMFGMNGSVAANFAVQHADCVIVIGEGLDDFFVGGDPGGREFAKTAQNAAQTGHGGIVHIAHDVPKHHKLWFQPTISIDADYEEVFKVLANSLAGPTDAHKRWLNRCQRWKSEYPLQLNSSGVGNHQISACQYLRLPHPHRLTSSWIYCTMGFGLPASVGVQLAQKDALVLNIDGDGSFGMTAMELATAVDHQLPIKTVIVNNQGHGMMKQGQSDSFKAWYKAAEIKAPKSWAALAEALGAKAFRLDGYAEMKATISQFLDAAEPVVLEAVVDKQNDLYPAVPWGRPLDEIFISENIQVPKPYLGQ